jgi:hypothetical protein
VTNSRLFHLAVVCCLIMFVLFAALEMLPSGFYDGAD